MRYIIHICDAPPHGCEYHKYSAFPKGCPAGITLKELGRLFYQKNIKYRLYTCGGLDAPMKTMETKFKQMFHDMSCVKLNNANEMKLEISKNIVKEMLFIREE